MIKRLSPLLFALMLLTVPVSSAANEVDLDGAKTCLGDYLSFINEVKDEHLRQGGIQAVFKLNSCQQNDYLKVDEAFDQTKDDLREALKTCEDGTELKSQYIKLTLEQYFIRSVAERTADYPSEADEKAVRGFKAELFDNLHREMDQYFTLDRELLTSKKLDQYFKEWTEKYDERVEEYVNCKEGVWAELTEKWDHLKETIDSMVGAFKKDASAPKADPPSSKINTSVQVKEIDVDGYKIFQDELHDNIEKNVAPSKTISDVSSEGTVNFNQVLGVLEQNRIVRSAELSQQERLARYTVLYGYSSSPKTEEMGAIISQMNDVLDEMSDKHLPQIAKMVEKGYEKQCN